MNRHFLVTHPGPFRPFRPSADALLLLSISVATAACFLTLGTVVFFWSRFVFFLNTAKDMSSMVKSCSYLLICAYVEATVHLFCPRSSFQIYNSTT